MHLLSRARTSIALAVILCAGLIFAMALPAAAARPEHSKDRAASASENGSETGQANKAKARAGGGSSEAAQSRRARPAQQRAGSDDRGRDSTPRSDNASQRARTAPNGPEEQGEPKATAADGQPGQTSGDGPAGNKGSVKVRPVGTAAHPPRHYPHLPCEVQVDFYGVPHDSATVTVRSHAPTAPTGEVLLTSDVDLAASSSNPPGNELVGTTTLDFTDVVDGLTYHEQQGYHVKLTAEIDGPQGANVKHKVFWVDCGEPTVEQSGPDAQGSEDDTSDDQTTTAAAPGDDELDLAGDKTVARTLESPAAVDAMTGGGDEVLAAGGERVLGAAAAGTTAAGDQVASASRVLAQTGLGALALALLALAGIGGGAMLVRRRR